ncbi:MFS transporter [Mesorhizobium sp. M0965]|uniref:MFS transporter n=1 Tax=Mesorhizobium sp. M0965 TaxID=2957036 RepID=UPI00333C997D
MSPWQESDQESSDFPAPERALDLKPRSGRIVARVGYSRAEKSIDALPGCIRAKRHAVTRAGARNWPLQRKLQMPPLCDSNIRQAYLDGLSSSESSAHGSGQESRPAPSRLHEGELSPQYFRSNERPRQLVPVYQPSFLLLRGDVMMKLWPVNRRDRENRA